MIVMQLNLRRLGIKIKKKQRNIEFMKNGRKTKTLIVLYFSIIYFAKISFQ
jgi:hypothetical protein